VGNAIGGAVVVGLFKYRFSNQIIWNKTTHSNESNHKWLLYQLTELAKKM
jgi:hypothetical protein